MQCDTRIFCFTFKSIEEPNAVVFASWYLVVAKAKETSFCKDIKVSLCLAANSTDQNQQRSHHILLGNATFWMCFCQSLSDYYSVCLLRK